MNYIPQLGIALLALTLTACGPKPEDVCDCVRQSANDWMLKGIRPSEAKLLAPCAEMMAKLKDNEAAKVKVEADYEDVQRGLNEKKLLAVDGKTPEFAALNTTLDSVLTDYQHDYEAAQYRYLNRPTLVTVTALYEETDSTRDDGLFASCTPMGTSASGKPTPLATRVKVPITAAVRAQLAASGRAMVFDRKRHRSIENDDRWYGYKLTDAGTPYRSGRSEADALENYLKGAANDLMSLLAAEHYMVEVGHEKDYNNMAAEVRAGDYILLKEGAKTGGEYGRFNFNKLTANGEIQLTGKNGNDLPVFFLKNATILKNEDLLPTLLRK